MAKPVARPPARPPVARPPAARPLAPHPPLFPHLQASVDQHQVESLLSIMLHFLPYFSSTNFLVKHFGKHQIYVLNFWFVHALNTAWDHDNWNASA
jgi:hypothetical protein